MEFFLGAFTHAWEQKKAAFLHEHQRGKALLDEEERRRRGGASATANGKTTRSTRGASLGLPRQAPARRTMGQRFQNLAQGSQPAVVKMTSFGGGARLGAMANYISRNGDVAMEDQLGKLLQGREAISDISQDWAHLMGNRAESRDIGTFRIDVARGPVDGQAIDDWARDIARDALGERSFAIAVSRTENGHRLEGVTVLRLSGGERLTADAKATEIVQNRLDARGEEDRQRSFRFTGHGNGVEYGTASLRALVEKFNGAVQDQNGQEVGDVERAGNLVQLKWRDQLHSRKARDVMHLVMSARAGTDVDAFRAAARDFLAAEFSNHRYVFSLHDPKMDPKPQEGGGKRPHVHVHAIVAMRSDDGDRVETTIASFRRWREGLAEQARAHGINMEMTDRRDRASAPAFAQSQVRPISREGRTEHEGTSAAGSYRYERKRREDPTAAPTARSETYTKIARFHWSKIAQNSEHRDVGLFADIQKSRLEAVTDDFKLGRTQKEPDDETRSKFRSELVTLSTLAEVDDMGAMTRSEFEAYEKRVENALFQAERLVSADERANFEEIAAAARDHVDVRREMMEQAEHAGSYQREAPDLRDPDDPNRQWDEAVARHGLDTVEAGNNIMIKVEYYRERIDRAVEHEQHAGQGSMQASLDFEIARAAELGAAGNTYLREIARIDEELRVAIDAAEHASGRAANRVEARDGRDTKIRNDSDKRSEQHAGVPRWQASDENRTDLVNRRVPRSAEPLRELPESSRYEPER